MSLSKQWAYRIKEQISYQWFIHLEDYFASDYFDDMVSFLSQEDYHGVLEPRPADIFNAFVHDYKKIKVVIIGQDPYPTAGTADGFAFSSLQKRTPASLRKIFTEIRKTYMKQDAKFIPWEKCFASNNLSQWSSQGVMLWNTRLTVRTGKPGSHAIAGWHHFNSYVIKALNEHPRELVFLLWGKEAQKNENLIDKRHHILKADHPSPKSPGEFLGCDHFDKANKLIKDRPKINWGIYESNEYSSYTVKFLCDEPNSAGSPITPMEFKLIWNHEFSRVLGKSWVQKLNTLKGDALIGALRKVYARSKNQDFKDSVEKLAKAITNSSASSIYVKKRIV